MSEVEQLVNELRELGIKLKVRGGKIKFGPKSKVTPELLLQMRKHHDEIIDVLRAESAEKKKLQLDKGSRGLSRSLYILIVCISSPILLFLLIPSRLILGSGKDLIMNEHSILIEGRAISRDIVYNVLTLNLAMFLVFSLVLFIPALFRFKNMGYGKRASRLMSALLFLPYLQWVVLIPLIVCQGNFAQTKVLDRPAIVGAWLGIIFLLLFFGRIILKMI